MVTVAGNIREAKEEDIDDIVDLEKISLGPVWEDEDIEYREENIRDFISSTFEHTRMLLYEEEGDILGFLHSNTYEDVVSGKKVCEVFTLTIHPDHFGERIGGELIDRARYMARKDGADILKLETLSSNERAIRFYRKKGFSEKKKIMTTRLEDKKEKEGGFSGGAKEEND